MGAFKIPDDKKNVKIDLKSWKSVKNNDWYATNLIVNPYEKYPIESYKRANRHGLLKSLLPVATQVPKYTLVLNLGTWMVHGISLLAPIL